MRSDLMVKTVLENGFFALAPNVLQNVINASKDGFPKIENDVKVSNGNVVYQEFENVAVISIDGGMYKKDMSGMCMSVVAYPNIIKAIKKADNAPHINTTLFRVDTPGGHVDGADEVEQAISSAKNKTVVIGENTMASGGLWIFPAADKMYATESTMLGSVGVVATYRNPDEDSKTIELTSKNAPNKRCKLGEDCKTKMQAMLNGYEDMFFARLEKNTGFSAEKIKTTFDNGGMIFATDALKAGFIQGITTFDSLLLELQANSGDNRNQALAKNQNSIEGVSMEYTKESFEALENSHAEALKVVTDKLEVSNTTLEKVTRESETTTRALADLKASVEEKDDATVEIMSMAHDKGVDKETLIKMAQAPTLVEAKAAVTDGMKSDGGFNAQNQQDNLDNSSANPWAGHFNNK